jgi:hypothetical protein
MELQVNKVKKVLRDYKEILALREILVSMVPLA